MRVDFDFLYASVATRELFCEHHFHRSSIALCREWNYIQPVRLCGVYVCGAAPNFQTKKKDTIEYGSVMMIYVPPHGAIICSEPIIRASIQTP
jgi:hypothetical protein